MVLYNGMASTSSWAALYFVALMTFGNYVLFNLLVAILVEGFQAEVRGRQLAHTRGGNPCQGKHPPMQSPQISIVGLQMSWAGHTKLFWINLCSPKFQFKGCTLSVLST